MKLRIKGNSIRIRVSQSELKTFDEKGLIADSINFGASKLTYLLQINEIDKVEVSFINNTISISVPTEVAKVWSGSDQVGFDANHKITKVENLNILVEKDFQCLADRGEDESDLFKNPRSEV